MVEELEKKQEGARPSGKKSHKAHAKPFKKESTQGMNTFIQKTMEIAQLGMQIGSKLSLFALREPCSIFVQGCIGYINPYNAFLIFNQSSSLSAQVEKTGSSAFIIPNPCFPFSYI